MVRFRPFNASGLMHLRTEMDRLMDDVLGRQGLQRTPSYPALNLWEQDQELVAEAELPGVRQEDLEISVVGAELTIKGRRPEFTDNGLTLHRRERGSGEFVRVVRLPVEIDAEKVQATLNDGVLRITLPKAEAVRPKKIEVKSGN